MKRSLWAGLLPLLLLALSIDFHPAAGDHEPLLGSQGGIYYPEAAHPGQPLHLEQAASAERPHCAACLHRLETRGTHFGAVAVAVLPALEGSLGVPEAPVESGGSRRSAGARAPPLS